MKKIILSFAILVASAAAVNADYVWDDGAGESSIGASSTNLGWLTQFNATAGNEIITNIQVAFGTGAAGNNLNGMMATAYIWSDPNGNGSPSDAVVLASGTGTISGVVTGLPLSNTFIDFPIAPTNVGPVGTSFFVGIIVNGMSTAAGGNFPAAIDRSGDQTTLNRTWAVFSNSAGGILPGDLGLAANNLTDINTLQGFGGRWMVRANVVPEPGSGMLLMGLAGLVALVRRNR